ncbi:MAG TPA: AbrB family transcriptional regulator [Xanthobacteraceae bacterium]|nr:AbrB family transcriptional regulator [Xanthobacteraceae bacterium]
MSQPSLDEIPNKTGEAPPQLAVAPATATPPVVARATLKDIATTTAILLVTFAIGLVGGYVGKLLNFPLPWMTGSLLLTAALCLAGVPLRSLWQVRAGGQFVTGAAVGTTFTPAILVTIVTLLPAMMLGALLSVGVAVIGSLILIRLAAVDAKTAALATMPGGVIEMGNVAQRVGADPLPIMVLQTMRVGLTVCAAPFLVTWLAEAGARNVLTQGEVMSWLTVLALMAASLAGGLFLNQFKLPNSWFLGSLFVMAALGAMELIPGRVPEPILVVAQVTIGMSIGTQYKHEFLTRLLRLLLASLVTVPFALIMMALIGALYAVVLGLPVTTLVLALAPAGIAEMALTGKVLGLDAALITGFQMVRIIMTLAVAAWTARRLERLMARWDKR